MARLPLHVASAILYQQSPRSTKVKPLPSYHYVLKFLCIYKDKSLSLYMSEKLVWV
jgi:hypothetical protein